LFSIYITTDVAPPLVGSSKEKHASSVIFFSTIYGLYSTVSMRRKIKPPVVLDGKPADLSGSKQRNLKMNYPAASCEVSKTQKEPSKSVS
jgi:hypothetical protein